jgi:hypothetical protein
VILVKRASDENRFETLKIMKIDSKKEKKNTRNSIHDCFP